MVGRRSGFVLAISTGVFALSAERATAFYCYVPEKPGGPVALRDRPNDGAKLVATMPPGGMVQLLPTRRQPEGWVMVRWQRQAQARTFDARGWARHADIHGGECAD